MTKSIYFIECTCIKDVQFPNVEFHVGDIVWYNKKASAHEMYLYNYRNSRPVQNAMEIEHNANAYRFLSGESHLPFTRQKKNAKKWQIYSYPERIKRYIEHLGHFTCQIKEIKLSYTEEEI